MNNFERITVFPGTHMPGVPYQIGHHNPTELPYIGAGAQGAVFQISAQQCVKIYVNESDAETEAKALLAAASASFIPQVYEVGRNYIVMEYFSGPGLKAFLSNRLDFPDFIAEQLVLIIKEMRRVQFTRVDTALRHVYVTPQNTLKVIDHVNSYRTIQPYPQRMLKSLSNIGRLQPFLAYVSHHHPELYSEWSQAQIIP
ncbi:hypothetical protein [Paenibacillus fonticola]|uniref:hypothetical protein n=1 Tax=Paenibacillus fonticola TaxID=379896 RepID=UPI000378BEA4|nr:hypothetical protein [Paenibacillus fonticola]